MSDPGCERVREWIPDVVADRLAGPDADAARAHLRTCADCAAEAELVALLYASRPAAPAGLVGAIEAGIRRRPGIGFQPWWGVAAAAVAAVALGIGVTSRSGPDDVELPAYVAEVQGLTPWVSEDGLIAGSPVLDDLSDEALLTLLDEMGAGGSGGAA